MVPLTLILPSATTCRFSPAVQLLHRQVLQQSVLTPACTVSCTLVHNNNKCSDRSMEVKLPALLGNSIETDQPTTSGQAHREV